VLFRTACSLPSEAQVGDPAADAVNAVCVGMVLALVCFNMCALVWTGRSILWRASSGVVDSGRRPGGTGGRRPHFIKDMNV
jgi:hypothetical protein